MKPGLSVVSICYGDDYWDRFSDAWFDSIRATDPRPDAVFLVTDVRRPVPAWVSNVVAPGHMAEMWNAGIAHVDTEWCWPCGFDDVFLPAAFEPIVSDADAVFFPHELGGDASGRIGYLGGYEILPTLDTNPMCGGAIHRTALLREIPLRSVGYCDWVHFSEMSHFGKSIEFRDEPRLIFVRHDDAFSVLPNYPLIQQSLDFNARLRAGLVEMGVPE